MDRCEEIKRKFNECGVSALLGITIDHVEEGLSRGRMTVTRNHTNVFGGIHGGILFAFADQVGGACGNSMDYKALLVESVARFKRSAREGDVLYAEARLVHTRKKIDTVDITVTNGRNEVLAVLKMTSYIVENAAKAP
jgi:phenylacetic acid degradation protein PaaD